MPKLRELIQTPPEPEGGAEEQLEALRDYLRKVTQELEYLLTHLEADNINDTTFERISEMIPRPYTGLPLMDGDAGAGTSAAWSRGNHRHPHDSTKADVTALEAAAADLEDAIEREADAREAHEADKANPHEVTKAQVGLGSVANERQYSAQNPPPIPTPGEVGAIPATDKGSAGGVAELDSNGHVPSSQLPSFVDDVKEYPSVTDFPIPGESDKIYIALDTDLFYRWGGTVYAPTNPSLALGETSSTAYRGDRGKAAYDHSQTTGNPHGTTAAEVGARPDNWMPSAAEVGARPDTWTPSAADVGARPDTWTPTAAEVGARPDTWTPTAADVGARPDTWTPSAADVGAVPTTRTINGYDLSQDRSLDAADVGARPDTWMPSAADVGARPDTWTPSAADVGARPDTWMPDAEDIPYDNSQSGLTATDVQAAIDELSQGGGGGGPSPSASNPEMDGTASPGTALTYARGDHVHPTDTSRAAAALEINGHALTGDFDLTAADVGARADTWTPSAADVGARPDTWMPTAADVGALASDGTAAQASAIATRHTISGASGWYKFLTVPIAASRSRDIWLLINTGYNLTERAGLLAIHTYGASQIYVNFDVAHMPRDWVRWETVTEDGQTNLVLYVYKDSGTSGQMQFYVLYATSHISTVLTNLVWSSEGPAASPPATATAATANTFQDADRQLWFSSVAVSAGTNQQILQISSADITDNHVLASITFADPEYITGSGSWASAAGSFTLTGTATAATTADVLLIRKGN